MQNSDNKGFHHLLLTLAATRVQRQSGSSVYAVNVTPAGLETSCVSQIELRERACCLSSDYPGWSC